MQRIIPIVLMVAALGTVAAVAAVTQSGIVKDVDQDASAAAAGNVRELVVGADVRIGETITTSDTGLVQLLFDDKTRLVVGPSSSLKIEDYLVRENGSPGKFAIAALAGTFRFITGTAPKDKYEITTPTGTIGVRGTSFDLTITEETPDFIPPADLTAALVLFDGALDLCNLTGDCVVLDVICGFGAFNDADAVTVVNNRAARDALRDLFPFALNQGQLLRIFWVTNARQCVSPAPVEGGGGSGLVTSTTVPSTTIVPTS